MRLHLLRKRRNGDGQNGDRRRGVRGSASGGLHRRSPPTPFPQNSSHPDTIPAAIPRALHPSPLPWSPSPAPPDPPHRLGLPGDPRKAGGLGMNAPTRFSPTPTTGRKSARSPTTSSASSGPRSSGGAPSARNPSKRPTRLSGKGGGRLVVSMPFTSRVPESRLWSHARRRTE